MGMMSPDNVCTGVNGCLGKGYLTRVRLRLIGSPVERNYYH